MEEKKIKVSLKAINIILIIVTLCAISVIIMLFINKENTQRNNAKVEVKENSTKQAIIEEDDKKTLETKSIKQAEGINIVPTMLDNVTSDSSWCGTFQLIWNDMKNEIVKKDIEFNPQLDIVKNLNKEDFKASMISDDYYYKIYGIKSLKLKEQIENGIKEKFNQTSDILEDFDWSENELDDPKTGSRRYFLYTMLYRKFEFLQELDKLDNDKFGEKYNNISYFGITKNTKDLVRKQITVLYYNSKDDFAILINTKSNDEVIFCKSPKGNNFNEIYENMGSEEKKYTGSKSFKSVDEFKAPNLNFNEKREYEELANKQFNTAIPEYPNGVIEKAIQSIKLSLDEKGGEIKSEAGIDMRKDSIQITQSNTGEPRYFYVDNTFALFLREKGKEKPYFAGRIDDITKFQ